MTKAQLVIPLTASISRMEPATAWVSAFVTLPGWPRPGDKIVLGKEDDEVEVEVAHAWYHEHHRAYEVTCKPHNPDRHGLKTVEEVTRLLVSLGWEKGIPSKRSRTK